MLQACYHKYVGTVRHLWSSCNDLSRINSILFGLCLLNEWITSHLLAMAEIYIWKCKNTDIDPFPHWSLWWERSNFVSDQVSCDRNWYEVYSVFKYIPQHIFIYTKSQVTIYLMIAYWLIKFILVKSCATENYKLVWIGNNRDNLIFKI